MKETELIYLRDGSPVRIRPLAPADKPGVTGAFERLSLQSRYQRFLSPLRELSPALLAYLTEIDYVDHFAYGAFTIPQPDSNLIGVARYIRAAGQPHTADVAVAVVDDFHRRGLGKQLLRALASVAAENQIRHFQGNVLWENHRILAWLRNAHANISPDGSGILRFIVDLPPLNPQDCSRIPFDNLMAEYYSL